MVEIITRLAVYKSGLEERVKRIEDLADRLIMPVYALKCAELMSYLSSKSQPSNVITLRNDAEKRQFSLMLPSIEYILQNTSPASKEVDSDGYFVDSTSEARVAKPDFIWQIFCHYELIYQHLSTGWEIVQVNEANQVIEKVNVEKFYRPG